MTVQAWIQVVVLYIETFLENIFHQFKTFIGHLVGSFGFDILDLLIIAIRTELWGLWAEVAEPMEIVKQIAMVIY